MADYRRLNNQSINQSIINLLFSLKHSFKQLYTSCKPECFSYKGGYGLHVRMRITLFERKTDLGYR